MNSRERVMRALSFQKVDRPAVQFYYAPVGYYEHGEKLGELYFRHPGDFESCPQQAIPVIPAGALDKEGRYYEKKADTWGTISEYRTFGIMGHAVEFPIGDDTKIDSYRLPTMDACFLNPPQLKRIVEEKKKDYFAMFGAGGILERMWLLRGFDNFMVDLAEDNEQINCFMDRLTDYYTAQVAALVAAGAEGISTGDDFGTQSGLVMSKDMFRRSMLPRLKKMLAPAREAGVHIHFHSCGKIEGLFEELKDIGVNSIWPQLPLYNLYELKDALRYYGFSIALHTDRAVTMTHGTPEEVRELVLLENEIFKPKDGGAWFYVETDTGFPFANIEMLVKTIYSI